MRLQLGWLLALDWRWCWPWRYGVRFCVGAMWWAQKVMHVEFCSFGSQNWKQIVIARAAYQSRSLGALALSLHSVSPAGRLKGQCHSPQSRMAVGACAVRNEEFQKVYSSGCRKKSHHPAYAPARTASTIWMDGWTGAMGLVGPYFLPPPACGGPIYIAASGDPIGSQCYRSEDDNL